MTVSLIHFSARKLGGHLGLFSASDLSRSAHPAVLQALSADTQTLTVTPALPWSCHCRLLPGFQQEPPEGYLETLRQVLNGKTPVTTPSPIVSKPKSFRDLAVTTGSTVPFLTPTSFPFPGATTRSDSLPQPQPTVGSSQNVLCLLWPEDPCIRFPFCWKTFTSFKSLLGQLDDLFLLPTIFFPGIPRLSSMLFFFHAEHLTIF